MRLPPCPHEWTVTPREAVAIQHRLAARVKVCPLPAEVRFVAGVDAAFPDGRTCVAAAVVWDLAEARVVETRLTRRPLTFPYVPGLLSFREAPAILDALALLDRAPEALLCDGQGRAHPRRFGLACHLGVVTGLPAIGCAKSRLCGTHREPGRRRGSAADLRDGAETIGAVVRTRDGVRPLFVSIGHCCTLPDAVRLVLAAGRRFRLPEPVRRADQLVGAESRAVRHPDVPPRAR